MAVVHQVVIYIALGLSLAAVADALCPAPFLLNKPVSSGRSTPPELNEPCCTDQDSCKCKEGLQCCSNLFGQKVCVDDPCTPNPCGEKGRCLTDGAGNMICLCVGGSINDSKGKCVDNPCNPNPCPTGPCTLKNDGDTPKASCNCPSGRTFDGKRCVLNSQLNAATTEAPATTRRAGRTPRVPTTTTTPRTQQAQPATSTSVPASAIAAVTSSATSGIPVTAAGTSGTPLTTVASSTVTVQVTGGIASTAPSILNATNTTDLCISADCGNGTCQMRAEGPFCICHPGAIFNGAQCIDPATLPEDFDPCAETDCGDAQCENRNFRPFCICNFGAFFNGSRCNQMLNVDQFPVPQSESFPLRRLLTRSIKCIPSNTPSTLDVGDAGNGTISSTSGCLKSRNYPDPYGGPFFDEVHIPSKGFNKIRINLQDLEMQAHIDRVGEFSTNDCVRDYLFVAGQLYCGTLPNEGIIDIPLRNKNVVVLGLASDWPNISRGFILRWQLMK